MEFIETCLPGEITQYKNMNSFEYLVSTMYCYRVGSNIYNYNFSPGKSKFSIYSVIVGCVSYTIRKKLFNKDKKLIYFPSKISALL